MLSGFWGLAWVLVSKLSFVPRIFYPREVCGCSRAVYFKSHERYRRERDVVVEDTPAVKIKALARVQCFNYAKTGMDTFRNDSPHVLHDAASKK
jgi:hypothetical protein